MRVNFTRDDGWFSNLISNKNAKGNKIIDLLNLKSFLLAFVLGEKGFERAIAELEKKFYWGGYILLFNNTWRKSEKGHYLNKIKVLLRINFNGFLPPPLRSNSFPNNHFSPFAVLNIKLMKRIHIEGWGMEKRIKFLFCTESTLTTLILERIIITNWCFYRADWCIESFQGNIWFGSFWLPMCTTFITSTILHCRFLRLIDMFFQYVATRHSTKGNENK